MDELQARPLQDLFRRVAKDRRDPRVGVRQVPLEIALPDPLLAALDDGAILLLALSEGRPRLPELGAVPPDAEEYGDRERHAHEEEDDGPGNALRDKQEEHSDDDEPDH